MHSEISNTPDETMAAGERLGREITAGTVIGLIGDLGAGKTQFVRGLARGLGVTERVHSPTFMLVNEYRTGRLPCYHLDLYRLETMEQFLEAGLEMYLRPESGVAVIEWFDRLGQKAPVREHLLIVRMEVINEMERVIRYEDSRA